MIYCVEDERNIRELLVYTLGTTGFQAKGLSDGKELFAALRRKYRNWSFWILCFLVRTDMPYWKS